MQQLQVVGERAEVEVYAPEPGSGVGDPIKVARQSIDYANRRQHDIVIVDTAGRLGIDAEMMAQAAMPGNMPMPKNRLLEAPKAREVT